MNRSVERKRRVAAAPLSRKRVAKSSVFERELRSNTEGNKNARVSDHAVDVCLARLKQLDEEDLFGASSDSDGENCAERSNLSPPRKNSVLALKCTPNSPPLRISSRRRQSEGGALRATKSRQRSERAEKNSNETRQFDAQLREIIKALEDLAWNSSDEAEVEAKENNDSRFWSDPMPNRRESAMTWPTNKTREKPSRLPSARLERWSVDSVDSEDMESSTKSVCARPHEVSTLERSVKNEATVIIDDGTFMSWDDYHGGGFFETKEADDSEEAKNEGGSHEEEKNGSGTTSSSAETTTDSNTRANASTTAATTSSSTASSSSSSSDSSATSQPSAFVASTDDARVSVGENQNLVHAQRTASQHIRRRLRREQIRKRRLNRPLAFVQEPALEDCPCVIL